MEHLFSCLVRNRGEMPFLPCCLVVVESLSWTVQYLYHDTVDYSQSCFPPCLLGLPSYPSTVETALVLERDSCCMEHAGVDYSASFLVGLLPWHWCNYSRHWPL